MGKIMRRTVLLAAASLLSGGVFAGAGVSVDVRKYGVCESDLLQTAALQAAIDAAAGAGGGEVVIPAGRFRTGGLVLKSGVALRSFCSGCRDFFRLGQNSGAGRFEKGSGEGLF